MSKLWIVCLAILFLAGTVVLAEDIQPPDWRGEWSTTSQVWEFSTLQSNPIKPDGPALGGNPPLLSTQLTVTPGPSMGWIDKDPSGRQGIWPLSGMMDVIVDNHNPPNEFKWVWVQITWRPQDPGKHPIIEPMIEEGYQTTPPVLVERFEFIGTDWFEDTYFWQIQPNPPDERFTITGIIDVDELVIDTWCIPEPATLGLLLVGGVLALIRRIR